MIITNDFVLLNFPKTGSTFARKAIKTIYSKKDSKIDKILIRIGLSNPALIELMLPKIDQRNHHNIVDQHGTYRQIPKKHITKPIITIKRNPFSMHLSNYLYRWWAKFPPTDIETIKVSFPNFPNLSFNEYIEMNHIFSRANRLNEISLNYDLGIFSIQFIQFYLLNPDDLLKSINEEYLNSKSLRNDFKQIFFLRNEHLAGDLCDFLSTLGFNNEELRFIIDMPKENESNKDSNNFLKYFSDSMIQDVLAREKLLFRLFPEYIPS